MAFNCPSRSSSGSKKGSQDPVESPVGSGSWGTSSGSTRTSSGSTTTSGCSAISTIGLSTDPDTTSGAIEGAASEMGATTGAETTSDSGAVSANKLGRGKAPTFSLRLRAGLSRTTWRFGCGLNNRGEFSRRSSINHPRGGESLSPCSRQTNPMISRSRDPETSARNASIHNVSEPSRPGAVPYTTATSRPQPIRSHVCRTMPNVLSHSRPTSDRRAPTTRPETTNGPICRPETTNGPVCRPETTNGPVCRPGRDWWAIPGSNR